mmetsp:Transcript_1335/g.1925  ORF Transcript_1335/g.1925 Transcript_1335/m.1925 type:complete len:92 (+) Transcript_1335:111-386(+)
MNLFFMTIILCFQAIVDLKLNSMNQDLLVPILKNSFEESHKLILSTLTMILYHNISAFYHLILYQAARIHVIMHAQLMNYHDDQGIFVKTN